MRTKNACGLFCDIYLLGDCIYFSIKTSFFYRVLLSIVVFFVLFIVLTAWLMTLKDDAPPGAITILPQDLKKIE